MGSQRRRLSDSLSAVKDRGIQCDGSCWDVGGLANSFDTSVCFSVGTDLRRNANPNDLDTLSDSSNISMKRLG